MVLLASFACSVASFEYHVTRGLWDFYSMKKSYLYVYEQDLPSVRNCPAIWMQAFSPLAYKEIRARRIRYLTSAASLRLMEEGYALYCGSKMVLFLVVQSLARWGALTCMKLKTCVDLGPLLERAPWAWDHCHRDIAEFLEWGKKNQKLSKRKLHEKFVQLEQQKASFGEF